MGTLDVYRITDRLDEATLDVLVARLEARGQHPRFSQMRTEYLDAMGIDCVDSVLDLGCDTGVAARAIARRPGFSGHVVGIDRSSHLIAAATRLSKQESLDTSAEFRSGDSHTLRLENESFDAVVANTLFSHLDDPRTVLQEIVRVVKPGGKVAIFDGDYASLTFAGDDPVKGKPDDEAIVSSIVTNPRVMRQMPPCALAYRDRNVTNSTGFCVQIRVRAGLFAPKIPQISTF